MFIKQLQHGGPFPLCVDGKYLNCWKPPCDSTATRYFLLNPHWRILPKSGVYVCVSFRKVDCMKREVSFCICDWYG